MQHDINAWLEQATPSYPAGLALLAASGYDQSSLTWQLLQRGGDSFTWTKLRGLLSAALAEPIGQPASPTQPVLIPAAATKPALDPAISRLLDERTQAKATLRAWLDDPGRAEDRRVLALRIKDITDELDELYHPTQETARPVKPLTLANVRTYVSLYKRKSREQPQNADYAQKLAHYQTLLTQLSHETI